MKKKTAYFMMGLIFLLSIFISSLITFYYRDSIENRAKILLIEECGTGECSKSINVQGTTSCYCKGNRGRSALKCCKSNRAYIIKTFRLYR